ncbi:hypothetical protein ACOSP7_019265 [Xanthoceras sorbifolium]
MIANKLNVVLLALFSLVFANLPQFHQSREHIGDIKIDLGGCVIDFCDKSERLYCSCCSALPSFPCYSKEQDCFDNCPHS